MNTDTLISHALPLPRRALAAKLLRSGTLAALLACFALPGHARADGAPGYLEVFSSTQQSQWGEGSYYYLHTGYRIYDSTGQAVKWVENHGDSADESPEKVELAPGTYVIRAQSDRNGYVRLPVVVKASLTTSIHLEDTGHNKKCLAME